MFLIDGFIEFVLLVIYLRTPSSKFDYDNKEI